MTISPPPKQTHLLQCITPPYKIEYATFHKRHILNAKQNVNKIGLCEDASSTAKINVSKTSDKIVTCCK